MLHSLFAIILMTPCTLFAGSSDSMNPCDLITQVEASDIMSEPMAVGELEKREVIHMQLCLYKPLNANSFTMLQVSIINGPRAKESFNGIKTNFPNHEAVKNIGDDAYFATPGLHILAEGYYLGIAAGNLKRNKDKLLAAGNKAVSNLKKKLK